MRLLLPLLLACAGAPSEQKGASDDPLPEETGSPDTDPQADTAGDTGAADTDPPDDSDSAVDTAPPPCDQPLQVSVITEALPSGSRLDLGETPAQASPLHATLTLTNPCAADQLRFLGHPDDWLSGSGFALDALPPVYLEPGASAEVALTFTPGDPGIGAGALSLPYDQVGSPYTLDLGATVTDPLPLVFFGEGRRVALTHDYGATWDADSYETLEAHTNALQRGGCAGDLGWLAVGGSDQRNFWTSADGLTWTAHSDGNGWIADCAFGDGLYLMVGSGGVLRRSADLSTWESGGSGAGSSLRAVAYGDGVFVAVGHDRRAVTADGLTFTEDQTSSAGETNRVAFGDGTFVAVGGDGLIETTLDLGLTWTAQTLGAGTWDGVVWAGDRFLIGNGAELYDSVDGVRWSLVNASTIVPLTAVGQMAFGVGSGAVYRSDDGGFTWTELLPAAAPGFLDAAPGVAP
jgi:hypothetical protein